MHVKIITKPRPKIACFLVHVLYSSRKFGNVFNWAKYPAEGAPKFFLIYLIET